MPPAPVSNKKFHCGQCEKTFTRKFSLSRHRIGYHSFLHTCFLCDPTNGKLVTYEFIKTHLAKIHGLKAIHNCLCCNYMFASRADKLAHQFVVGKTGQLGEQFIVAKSDRQPGSLLQENIVTKQTNVNMESARTTEVPLSTVPPSKKRAQQEKVSKMIILIQN